MCRILRHNDQLREAYGAVEWEKFCADCNRQELILDVSDWNRNEVIEQLAWQQQAAVPETSGIE